MYCDQLLEEVIFVIYRSTQLPLDVFDESEIARVLKKRSKVATKVRNKSD